MGAAEIHEPSLLGRIGIIARILYVEAQYYLVGLTPESYHWRQGSAWESLGNYRRAAHHLSRYLESSENAHARALLAYCYTNLESWTEAAREYAAARAVWPHPSFALGEAEAHVRLGNTRMAQQIIAEVEATPALEDVWRGHIASLRSTMQSMSNYALERTRGG